ncbi:DUF1254 domain-containing protein [Mycetocola tolaasinivorans]|uniref:DUF1254 domain-containing protein n=1 Tax=Mycetocola tolaasinivorans TaxID=76635 RepID=A0A3L7AAN7_9MICO|nr:DUF1254 domain-containing protein [Mycetocola tolaasinivorans]RLP77267.1 DUF1254 domain-containing protein [Mycetocola tolaasinivorans]
MTATRVTADNFVRAESNRMFAALLAGTEGVGHWVHHREPSALDDQRVIRQNRDTLYSSIVLDVSEGATLTLPDAEGRYLSAALISQDQYTSRVLHDAGEHAITRDEVGSDFVLVAVRVLVDPTDPADVAAANRVQDGLAATSASSRAFELPEYDAASLDSTRNALLELGRGFSGFDHSFGTREEVEPIRHLIGAALGWGGLPESEAYYVNVDDHLPVAEYSLTLRDVPVDAFWSVSLYNAEGYFEPIPGTLTSVNSVTGERAADGSITVRFAPVATGAANELGIMPGWNYLVRYYRPRPEVIDGSWTLPALTPAEAGA